MSLRLLRSLDDVSPVQWDSLHDGANPFVSHAFLSGLEQHGCLSTRRGWQAQHAGWFVDGKLAAAAPAYLKTNSHGEFVFDHAWAHAYARYGHRYFPKWLVAVPYSPVGGPRLLAADARMRARLAEAMIEMTRAQRLSSVHVNFMQETELDALSRDWLARADVQFHWRNEAGWTDFDSFLGAFNSRKRKTLRAEREQVRRAGCSFRVVNGSQASDRDLADMHRFYCLTQSEKGNQPALTLEFFQHLSRAIPAQLVLILAERSGETIAGAMCLRGGDTLYGRYWGAEETIPGLHFETCYYQGIEYCLREGLTRFEPGAQGEHKIARGFLPVLTHSRHYLADPEFSAAIGEWCAQERESVLRYRDLVLQHSPFRAPTANSPAGQGP